MLRATGPLDSNYFVSISQTELQKANKQTNKAERKYVLSYVSKGNTKHMMDRNKMVM